MMSRPKAFLKVEKGKKRHARNKTPQTADDVLADGVELEEAGEKWRAGDAVKSMRFFNKALDRYSQGLERFPKNLDLAYNKARIQYEVATHPVLVTQLQVPLLDVLEEALASNQYALQLDQDNPDSLFNTAQVMTSLAEELAKDDRRPDTDAVRYLEQALELFQRCLAVQELRYTEAQNQAMDVPPIAEDLDAVPSGHDNQAPDDEGSGNSPQQDERWASIIEPVTRDTLIDTSLAQIATLTTLSGLLSQQHASLLPWIEDCATKLLNVRMPAYINDSNRTAEIALAKANLMSAILEAGFRAGRVDLETYIRERDSGFSNPDLAVTSSVEALTADATSLISLNAAIADIVDHSSPQSSTLPATRWKILSSATEQLTRASKIPGTPPPDLFTTHTLRGDVAFLLHRLGRAPYNYGPSVTNSSVLLNNAVTFYRNAAKLAQDPRQKSEAQAKGVVAMYLKAGGLSDDVVNAIKGLDQQAIKTTFTDMVDEALVQQDVVEQLWSNLQGLQSTT